MNDSEKDISRVCDTIKNISKLADIFSEVYVLLKRS